MVPAHLVMGITHIDPVVPMIALGAAFVLVPACLWPSVPLIVEESRVGTAFSLMTARQNIGLLAFLYFNGALRDATHGYTASQIIVRGARGRRSGLRRARAACGSSVRWTTG